MGWVTSAARINHDRPLTARTPTTCPQYAAAPGGKAVGDHAAGRAGGVDLGDDLSNDTSVQSKRREWKTGCSMTTLARATMASETGAVVCGGVLAAGDPATAAAAFWGN